MSALKKVRSVLSFMKHYPSYPGVIMSDSEAFLRFYERISKSLNGREYKQRALLSDKVAMESVDIKIADEDGFLVADMSKNNLVRDALKHVKSIADSVDWEEKQKTSKKAFLIHHKLDLFESENEVLLKLATSAEIIKPISEYLGTFPILSSAAIWYSPNEKDQSKGSQLYHLDGEDLRQVKCFIPIDEITKESGPLTILPANVSDGIYQRLRDAGSIKRRNTKLVDDVIYDSVYQEKDAIKVTGKPGTVAFVDTCRCYHYGSREAQKPRLLLHLHFYSAFSKMMPLWGRDGRDVPASIGGETDMNNALIGKSHLAFSNARSAKMAKLS